MYLLLPLLQNDLSLRLDSKSARIRSFCPRLTMAVVFYGNPFRFILRTLPVSPFLKAVVLVIAAVEYAADNIQRDRGPVITGTSPVTAMFVQIPAR